MYVFCVATVVRDKENMKSTSYNTHYLFHVVVLGLLNPEHEGRMMILWNTRTTRPRTVSQPRWPVSLTTLLLEPLHINSSSQWQWNPFLNVCFRIKLSTKKHNHKTCSKSSTLLNEIIPFYSNLIYHVFRQHELIVTGEEVLFYFQLAAADM